MDIRSQFERLVRDLDKDALDELKQSVAVEIEGRSGKASIKLEHIHPAMSAEEKEQAAREIARVLRGQD